jgi:cytoskeletal protein CcmA (bactofilin family)
MLRRSTPPPPATPSEAVPAAAASPARRFTDVVGGSVFGPTLRIRGSIIGADAVEIAGQVEGPIEVDGLLHVADGARVTGPVTATDAVIEGELQGRLTARGRVELRASAKVRADVHASTVAIAEGCFFDGRIHMGASEGDGGPTRFREKRRRRGRGGAGADTHAAGAAPAPGSVPTPEPAAEPTPQPAADPAPESAPAAAEPAAPAASDPAAPAAKPIPPKQPTPAA